MEQHVFAFSSIIEGITEKVLKFIMPLKSIYNRNFGFHWTKIVFPTVQRVSSKNITINWDHFCPPKLYLLTLLELPPICFHQYYTKMCVPLGSTTFHQLIVSSNAILSINGEKMMNLSNSHFIDELNLLFLEWGCFTQ